MKKVNIILLILVFSTSILTAQSKYFTGKVHKIDKYKKVITCEGADLTPINVGQSLYICDKNKKLIATVKVTRFYTTIIETKLVSGNLDMIKVKTPVYSHKSQFEKKKLSKKIKHLTEKTIGGIVLIYLKGGEFMMGADGDVKDDVKPSHRVYVSSLWIGKYELTQKQYKTIMNKNPSRIKGDNFPVIDVRWNDAMEFCRKFSAKYGVKVRLPYEAEWEYACRAGTSTTYYWGNSMNGDYAWYDGNSGMKTHPVGLKKPNQWDLYDMSGNANEWCMDWYSDKYYSQSSSDNPKGPSSGSKKVRRGGAYGKLNADLRVSLRCAWYPAGYSIGGGFRVVRTD